MNAPVAVLSIEHTPVEVEVLPIFTLISPAAAFANGDVATERTPAVNAVTATSAMRCFIVFVDICFLSLVELGNFPISARRSFDLLILFPYGTHV